MVIAIVRRLSGQVSQLHSKGPMGGHGATYTVDMFRCADYHFAGHNTNVESQGYHSSKEGLARGAAIENASLSNTPEVFATLLPLAKRVQY